MLAPSQTLFEEAPGEAETSLGGAAGEAESKNLLGGAAVEAESKMLLLLGGAAGEAESTMLLGGDAGEDPRAMAPALLSDPGKIGGADFGANHD